MPYDQTRFCLFRRWRTDPSYYFGQPSSSVQSQQSSQGRFTTTFQNPRNGFYGSSSSSSSSLPSSLLSDPLRPTGDGTSYQVANLFLDSDEQQQQQQSRVQPSNGNQFTTPQGYFQPSSPYAAFPVCSIYVCSRISCAFIARCCTCIRMYE